jgi:hypothetical protein
LIIPLSLVLGAGGIYLWSFGFLLDGTCGGRWTETDYCRHWHLLILIGFGAGFVVAPILLLIGVSHAVRHLGR